jgi:hypothetical protein
MSAIEPERSETQASTAEQSAMQECNHGLPSSGSFVQTIAGAAAVILAILGLAGLQNTYLLAIVTIIVGVALLDEGCTLLARCAKILCEAKETCYPVQISGGLGSELLAGGVGVVLGLLALLGVAAQILVPAAIIVFGTALAWSSCLRARLCCVECVATGKSEAFHLIARQATLAAAGAQVLIGMAAVILGILGVLGTNATVLSMVALLVLGFAVLLSGMASGGRMWIALSHR